MIFCHSNTGAWFAASRSSSSLRCCRARKVQPIWPRIAGSQVRYSMQLIDHQASIASRVASIRTVPKSSSSTAASGYRPSHHITGAYLTRFAKKSAWREDHRRMNNGGQQTQAIMQWRRRTRCWWTGAGSGRGRKRSDLL
jgi:hypothetical protein